MQTSPSSSLPPVVPCFCLIIASFHGPPRASSSRGTPRCVDRSSMLIIVEAPRLYCPTTPSPVSFSPRILLPETNRALLALSPMVATVTTGVSLPASTAVTVRSPECPFFLLLQRSFLPTLATKSGPFPTANNASAYCAKPPLFALLSLTLLSTAGIEPNPLHALHPHLLPTRNLLLSHAIVACLHGFRQCFASATLRIQLLAIKI